jgi:hypothetical protein
MMNNHLAATAKPITNATNARTSSKSHGPMVLIPILHAIDGSTHGVLWYDDAQNGYR